MGPFQIRLRRSLEFVTMDAADGKCDIEGRSFKGNGDRADNDYQELYSLVNTSPFKRRDDGFFIGGTISNDDRNELRKMCICENRLPQFIQAWRLC